MRKDSARLYGLILCGGQSLRMGKDKGLMELEHKPWVEIVAEKLSHFDLKVNLSLRSEQEKSYQKINADYSRLPDARMRIAGPARGIISAHQRYPENDWLVISCDMVRVTESVLLVLLESYRNFQDNEFYYYINGENPEPLCSIYKSKGLKKMESCMNNSGKYSLSEYLVKSSSLVITADTEASLALKSYNSPDDFSL